MATDTAPLLDIRDRIVDFRRIPARDLQGHNTNWRTHPQAQHTLLREVLTQIGVADALVIYESERQGGLTIIDGHLRQEDYPDTLWPCLVTDLDDAEADLFLTMKDPLAAMAQTNGDKYAELLQMVQDSGIARSSDLLSYLKRQRASVGLANEEHEDLGGTLSKIDELTEKWGVELGQLWALGEHRIMCGDSTDPASVEMVLNGAAPEIMVTDPPYGVDYDPTAKARLKGIKVPKVSSGQVANDAESDWTEAYRHFPGAVAYIWHSALFGGEVADHLAAVRFDVRAQIIWRKARINPSRGHYKWQHEPCWYAVRKGKASKWAGDRGSSTIWDIAGMNIMGGDHKDATGHSTQKPVECMERPIRNHSCVGVYDPFLGSGTTLMAAEHLNQTCWGLDIEPGYVAVTLERWATYTGVTPVRL